MFETRQKTTIKPRPVGRPEQALIDLLVKERIELREKLTFEIDYEFFKPYMPDRPV